MNDPNEAPKESPELTEDALKQVNGGGSGPDGIPGESQDDKHKD
jgi:hypothetical protein